MSCLPSYYKYENDQKRVFSLIKQANKAVEPHAEPRVECQTDPNTGLETYIDEFGNVYKLLPLPPWHDTEESRKGGIKPGNGPKQIPPRPSQAVENPRMPQVDLKALPSSSGSSQIGIPSGLNPRELSTSNISPQTEKERLTTVDALHKATVKEQSQSQEHMLVDKYQLVPIVTTNPILCLYDNGKGTLFQLFCLRNGKAIYQSEMPKYPMMYT